MWEPDPELREVALDTIRTEVAALIATPDSIGHATALLEGLGTLAAINRTDEAKVPDAVVAALRRELEARLRANLPGEVSAATVGAAIRILERHGMLRRDPEAERMVATRPTESTAGLYPPLDVESLQRRAEVERGKLRAMVELAYYPRCRRQFVLEYFGDQEWASRDRTCGACDNCEALLAGKQTGLSDTDRQAIQNLLRLVGSMNGRFGRKRVAMVANGTDTDPRFYELAERNTLHAWPERLVLDLLRALEGVGLVEASRGEYPTISTTRKGDQVAFGQLDPADLGVQMPVRGASSSRRKRIGAARKR